jgi:hypothetical protein
MNSPLVKRLRALEQNRSTRYRQASQRVVQTLKHADEAAKSLLLQDLSDVTAAVVDVLQEWKDAKAEDSSEDL